MHFIRVAPVLMVAAFMFGLIDESILALLVVYGMRKGLDEAAAGLLLASFIGGAVVGQFPVGWLADRIDRTKVITGCIAIAFVLFLVLPFAVGDRVLSALVLGLMGATVGSTYTVALAMMGERFKGGGLVGITTCFMFLWACGSFIAPALSGAAMELTGPDGMPMLAAFLSALFPRNSRAGDPEREEGAARASTRCRQLGDGHLCRRTSSGSAKQHHLRVM